MEFIDKSNQAIFLPIYSDFENTAWNDDDEKYHGYVYSKLPTDLKTNLIIEQNALCCYCMIQLENDRTTTLEHIFPQKPIVGDSLGNYNVLCIDNRQFDYSFRNIPINNLINLPHDISYYNLIASCNSSSSCNNCRGNAIISSFFFDPNVRNEFTYDDNGEIFSQRYFNEIVILGLSDSTLVQYRKFWRFLKSKNITISFGNLEELKTQILIGALELGAIENDLFFQLFIEENEMKVMKAIKFRYFFDN